MFSISFSLIMQTFGMNNRDKKKVFHPLLILIILNSSINAPILHSIVITIRPYSLAPYADIWMKSRDKGKYFIHSIPHLLILIIQSCSNLSFLELLWPALLSCSLCRHMDEKEGYWKIFHPLQTSFTHCYHP